MFLSRYGKSYDTSDGSGQQSRAAARRSNGQARERWEDDGGPLRESHAVLAGEKPAWSVLSLCDLNEAIRRERRADDAARLRQESQRRERLTLRALELNADRAAAAARVQREWDRNAWENTPFLPDAREA
jgi:hypothetical protein